MRYFERIEHQYERERAWPELTYLNREKRYGAQKQMKAKAMQKLTYSPDTDIGNIGETLLRWRQAPGVAACPGFVIMNGSSHTRRA